MTDGIGLLGTLTLIVGAPFVGGLLALALPARWSGRIALLPPLLVVAVGVPLWPRVSGGEVLRVPVEWFPSLGLTADLRADRLGVLFVLLVGGIGLGVVQYARHYLGPKARPAFWAALLAFMGAMLGIVLSDSLLLLFVFWELTTISSALLIGMDFEREDARKGAVQAFLVTGIGGLALLAGVVVIGELGGSYTFSGLERRAAELVADPRHVAPLLLLLVGAFTKSAQFPFHFWLPGAMAAPAPVSAYLHSATMVKAGVFLLGRLFPIFNASPVWFPVLTVVGLTTFLLAAWHAVRSYDLKQLLAWSTVSYLGVLTALYGYYARVGLQGELLNILNHAVYKSSLFLLIGWLEKAAGTRDLSLLEREKWVQRQPAGAVLVGIGAVAMMGLPFLLGFMSKEAFYAALAGGKPTRVTPALVLAALASTLATIYSLKLFVGTFWGWRPAAVERGRQRVSPWLLLVPGLMLVPQVLGGVVPGWFLGSVLEPSGEWPVGIAVWRHADVKTALGVGILVLGVFGFRQWRRIAALPAPPGVERLADGIAHATLSGAAWLSRAIQAGGHPRYLSVLLVVSVAMLAAVRWGAGGAAVPPTPGAGPTSWLALLPSGLVVGGTALTLVARSRVTKLVMLAVVGYGMAVMFVLFRAPDLALTQLLVETVSVVLLLLIFRQLPRLRSDRRVGPTRAAHALVACAAGAAMAALTWTVGSHAAVDPTGARHLELSYPEAKGANVVNVVLVDFRGLDTLGEVAVLAIAAFGVLALFRGGAPAPVHPPEGGAMRSLILLKVSQAVLPVTVLFALYLLLRGHNEPGGGFVAGLVTAAAILLQGLAFGGEYTRGRLVRVLRPAAPVGLLVALAAALAGPAAGREWLTHFHAYLQLPGPQAAHLSTTLLFDLGVYLAVVGVAATFMAVFARGVR